MNIMNSIRRDAMLGLAYKDFCLGKKDFCLYGGMILLLSAAFFVPYSVKFMDMASIMLPIFKLLCILCAYLCLGAIQQSFLNADEQTGYRHFMCTTPLRLEGIVKCRFLQNLGSTAVLSAWLLFASYIQKTLTGQNCGENYVIYGLFLVHLLILSLDVPFYFRFGLKYGKYYKMGLFFLLIMFLLWFILYGDLGKEASLYALVEWSLSFNLAKIAAIFARFSPLVRVVPFGILLLYYASYRLSCACCQKSCQC